MLEISTTTIYECVDGIIYARAPGSPIRSRVEIYRTEEKRMRDRAFEESLLWDKVLEESERNPALKDAIEKCKIIYYLSKENGHGKT